MDKLTSLKEVSASMLPVQVMVLLPKYADAVREHLGLVIKISSMNVFLHIDHTSKLSEHSEIRSIYNELLSAVNQQLLEGTMRTNEERGIFSPIPTQATQPSLELVRFAA